MKFFKLLLTFLLLTFSLSSVFGQGYKERFVPAQRNTISADIGSGWIFSDIFRPKRYHHTKNGLDWKVEYNHIFKIGIGIGMQYAGFRTEFEDNLSINLSYIAPQFVYRFKLNSFILKAGIGTG